MDLTAVRKGLAARAKTLVPNAYHYAPATITSFPAVWIDFPESGAKLAFQRGDWDFDLRVVAAMSDVWDRSSQEKVDELMVELWPVLEADPTLGGAVNGSVHVVGVEPIKPQDNVPWVGAVFQVRVVHTDA